jgi:glycosyltransferase involved in cell wall biosynthesis
LEVILVDNGSEDSTKKAIRDFTDTSPFKVACVEWKNPGLGWARTFGVNASKGEWLLLTDDDCYIEKTFFVEFFNFVQTSSTLSEGGKRIRYGSGPIIPSDNQHDLRVANLAIERINLIRPYSYYHRPVRSQHATTGAARASKAEYGAHGPRSESVIPSKRERAYERAIVSFHNLRGAADLRWRRNG